MPRKRSSSIMEGNNNIYEVHYEKGKQIVKTFKKKEYSAMIDEYKECFSLEELRLLKCPKLLINEIVTTLRIYRFQMLWRKKVYMPDGPMYKKALEHFNKLL